jgi:hypothetical protein
MNALSTLIASFAEALDGCFDLVADLAAFFFFFQYLLIASECAALWAKDVCAMSYSYVTT